MLFTLSKFADITETAAGGGFILNAQTQHCSHCSPLNLERVQITNNNNNPEPD